MLLILICIIIFFGGLQYWLLYNQVKENINTETSFISQGIIQGIESSELAVKEIENQIDIKLAQQLRDVSALLPNRFENIDNSKLIKVKEQLEVAGIDIIANQKDILTITKSSESINIGYTIRSASPEAEHNIQKLLNREQPEQKGTSYVANDIVILPADVPGLHNQTENYKIAFYHDQDTNFVLTISIDAYEVKKFTHKVGPDAWINEILEERNYVKEIAVLNPRLYVKPELKNQIYPRLKKIVHGQYEGNNHNDILVNMANNPSPTSQIDVHDSEKVYTMFIPYKKDRVIYIALDYLKMSQPLKSYAIILLSFSFISLFLLFLWSTRFFKTIYTQISLISNQIKALEAGDITARSNIDQPSELKDLSNTTNAMANALNKVIVEMHEQAIFTEKNALLLYAEADNSVEKALTLSTKTTENARENLEYIEYFLKLVEEAIEPRKDPLSQKIMDQIGYMHQLAKKRTNFPTELTITLMDLLNSLKSQSNKLSENSSKLLKILEQFNLDEQKKDRS